MATEPIRVSEALEQARQARAQTADLDQRRLLVFEQIADELIQIRWIIEGIATRPQDWRS
jgi:hypothetical protein